LRKIVGGVLVALLWSGSAFAANLGADKNGNAIWDDFDEVIAQSPPFLSKVTKGLASGLQEFTLAAPGNRSLATQAMLKVQENMLCLMAVGGTEGGQLPAALKERIDRVPERSKRFRKNEALIAGENLPFDPDPSSWRKYCPKDLSFPQPVSSAQPPGKRGG